MRRAYYALMMGFLIAAPSSARADDLPEARLAAEDLELLPLSENKKRLLFLRHSELVGPIGWRAREAAKARARIDELGERPRAAQQRKKLERLNSQNQTALAQFQEILRAEGVSDDALAGLQGFPAGPQRPQRFAHSLVLGLETLDPRRRALLTELVGAVDGAKLALIAHRKRYERGADDGSRGQQIRQVNQQIYWVERRFWQAMDSLLDPQEKAQVRSRLPHGVSQVLDPLNHALRLPGITPSQGARLHALVAEIESETAADQAEVRRLQAQIQATPQPERKPLQEQIRLVRLRVAERVNAAAEAGKEILTPAQWEAFQSIPPYVAPGDRSRDVQRLVRGIPLSADQRARLQDVGARVRAARQELQGDMRRIGQMSQDFGPDSPQMQSMQVMRMGVEAEGQVVARALTREVFVEVLSPTQVTGWVVGLYEQ